ILLPVTQFIRVRATSSRTWGFGGGHCPRAATAAARSASAGRSGPGRLNRGDLREGEAGSLRCSGAGAERQNTNTRGAVNFVAPALPCCSARRVWECCFKLASRPRALPPPGHDPQLGDDAVEQAVDQLVQFLQLGLAQA